MAGASLLTLLDDIATMLDDVSVMTKVAAKKTAGVLGDDLALNAQQVTGVKAARELPVVWEVAKGSFRNKFILVPAALLISAFIPWMVTVLLMLGGAFLCFEGTEKLAHKFLHPEDKDAEKARKALTDPNVDPRQFEQKKIKGAIRTDFILSAEIIAITLGTVAGADIMLQVIVVSGIALFMTVGVFGLVAGIVKLDDLGIYLSEKSSSFAQTVGNGIVTAAPYLMKTLSFVGTAAMFMVGGGILTHGLPLVEHAIEDIVDVAGEIPTAGAILQPLGSTLFNMVFGLIVGAVILGIVEGVKRLRGKSTAHS
nr:DUF808 domain-containing protein [uncultured Halomonas sp.]